MKIRFLVLVLVFGISTPSIAAKYEQPEHEVTFKEKNIEIRVYDSLLLAEVNIKGPRSKAANRAFFTLFDFISGSNSGEQEIQMTSPVFQSPGGSGESWDVSFVMPSKFSLENLPAPNNEFVLIREISSRKMAAIRFSGRWSDRNMKKHSLKLKEFLDNNNYQYHTRPIYAFYNAPFVPWFLRRNEVLYEIIDHSEEIIKK